MRELDKALEYELQLSEHLQQEILREYKSLDTLLQRYEQYRLDDAIIQQSSFFEYYEMLDAQEKKVKSSRLNQSNGSIDPSKASIGDDSQSVDLSNQLPLLSTSDFLDKVGKAFAKLPQSGK